MLGLGLACSRLPGSAPQHMVKKLNKETKRNIKFCNIVNLF